MLLAASRFEAHYLGQHSTLCQSDFDQVNQHLCHMKNNHMLSTAQLEVDVLLRSLEQLIDEQIIGKHGETIERLVTELLQHDTLNEQQLIQLLDEGLRDQVTLPKEARCFQSVYRCDVDQLCVVEKKV